MDLLITVILRLIIEYIVMNILKFVNNRMATDHETKYPQISSNFQFLFFKLFVFSFSDRCFYKKHPLRKLNIEMFTESQSKINFTFLLERAGLKSNVYFFVEKKASSGVTELSDICPRTIR